MNTPNIAIIIPFYKNTLSKFEKLALGQCFNILSEHPIICIKPHSLKLDHINQHYSFAEVACFDNEYFESVQGYNRLMLSSEFYGAFLKFEFILIYQLDALVFSDDLNYWCNRKYDYIGAPWLNHSKYPDFVKKIKSHVQSFYHTRWNIKIDGNPTGIQFENKVGNGGFSLRRVKKFYDLSRKFQVLINYYNTQNHHHYHEDAFWSIEVNRKQKNLRIPNYKEALKFSFENSPERCFELNNKKLPFGCHAWDKHMNFWKPILKELNFTA